MDLDPASAKKIKNHRLYEARSGAHTSNSRSTSLKIGPLVFIQLGFQKRQHDMIQVI